MTSIPLHIVNTSSYSTDDKPVCSTNRNEKTKKKLLVKYLKQISVVLLVCGFLMGLLGGYMVYVKNFTWNGTYIVHGTHWMNTMNRNGITSSITTLSFAGTRNSFSLYLMNSSNTTERSRIAIDDQIEMGNRYFELTLDDYSSDNITVFVDDLKQMLFEFKHASIVYSSEYLILNINGNVDELHNETVDSIYNVLGDNLIGRNVNGTRMTLDDVTINNIKRGKNVLVFYNVSSNSDVYLGNDIWNKSELLQFTTTGHYSDNNVDNENMDNLRVVTKNGNTWHQNDAYYDGYFFFDNVCTSLNTVKRGCLGIYSFVDVNAFTSAYMHNFMFGF